MSNNTNTWKPIETAPKIGSFLVWMEKPELSGNIQPMNKKQVSGGIMESIGHYFSEDCRSKPTHWMEIPKPPNT
jgi:hypothetical protein